MPRKLKAFVTSIGFFDLAVAAPSMKAAAEAWGADPDIFRQGHAAQTDDPEIVKATTAAPGVVLRRPVGSNGKFTKNATLPAAPKPRRANRADGGDEEKKKDKEQERRQARQKQAIEKAEAALSRAWARHAEALRSLAQRREKITAEEQRESERWERAQRTYQAALKAAKG